MKPPNFQEMVAKLRLALEEALCGHSVLQQELELLRTSSSDVEFVEHIRALEEQLGLKTAELKKHRAAATHVQELRATLRGLEERVGQSTAALQNSLLQGSRESSPGSSRQPSPSPLLPSLASGSFEDMGGAVVEVEEVARLEKKVRELEGAEAGAVARVRVLEGERRELRGRLEEQEARGQEQEALLEEQEARRQELVARTELQDTAVTGLEQQVSSTAGRRLSTSCSISRSSRVSNCSWLLLRVIANFCKSLAGLEGS